jgi:drug/metabolite transporter (DMT)-like permease
VSATALPAVRWHEATPDAAILPRMADAALYLGFVMLAMGVPLFVITAFIPIGRRRGRPNSESVGRWVAVLLIIFGLLIASGGCWFQEGATPE